MHNPLEILATPQVISEPYTFYAQLRREAPIVQDVTGAWVVSRYRDVHALLTHPQASAQRIPAGNARPDPLLRDMFEALRCQILFLDPPQHTRLRGLISQAFTPRAVQGMRGAIQHTVDALLAKAVSGGAFDVIGQLAVPLPLRVICDMLDIPHADRAQLKRWSEDYARLLGHFHVLPREALLGIAHSLTEYMQYFRQLSVVRREHPGTDLLSALLRASDQDGALDREAACATAVLLITAGHETTTHLIGNGLLALLNRPEVIEQLQSAPELWPNAIEELLRFDSPVQFVARRAVADIAIEQHTIGAGELVFLLTGAANRDPERFVDPDRVAVMRAQPKHCRSVTGRTIVSALHSRDSKHSLRSPRCCRARGPRARSTHSRAGSESGVMYNV